MSTLFIKPNEFQGSDASRINQAIAAATERGLIAVIPKINAHAPAGQPRDLWLLDEAITLPSDATVELHNATIKLSDKSRDNFFRSANCGLGINPIEPAKNIHLTGKGHCVLVGADRPRATGDSAKTLGERTYGTDAGKDNESQRGDWRNIGILMANVSDFSIQNITMKDSHCWAVSLEYCTHGQVRDLHFESTGNKVIDGQTVRILNQDGLDLRQGCNNILIENITGHTGDDLIALTAIFHQNRIAGNDGSTMVSGGGTPQDAIHSITIRNVRGHCAGGHHIVRFLNTGTLPMYDIIMDGLIDTSVAPHRSKAAVKIGDHNTAYGGINALGLTRHFFISNIITRSQYPIFIGGSLCDSVISNVIQHDYAGDPVFFQSGEQYIRNVKVINVQNTTPVTPV